MPSLHKHGGWLRCQVGRRRWLGVMCPSSLGTKGDLVCLSISQPASLPFSALGGGRGGAGLALGAALGERKALWRRGEPYRQGRGRRFLSLSRGQY